MPITVVRTNKRGIENYLHYDAVDRICGAEVNLPARTGEIDRDFTKMSEKNGAFWQALSQAKTEIGFRFPDKTVRGVELDYLKPKHVICGILLPAMTLGELRERCRTTDTADQDRSEVEGWFQAMADLVRAARDS